MTKISGHFDELQLWDSAYLGKPVINDTEIMIPVRHIEVDPGHPLNHTDKPILLPEGQLIFSGVRKSERLIGEYLGDPKSGAGFKATYKITDGPFATTDEGVEAFVVEGVSEDPWAWITWEIESVSFALQVSQSLDAKFAEIDSDATHSISTTPQYLPPVPQH